MNRITISLNDSQSEFLEEVAGDGGEHESKSAAVRSFIDGAETKHELQEEIDRLRDRLESREERIDELESQLRKREQIEEKIEDLPDKLRDADTYTERRQRKLDRATLAQRLRWKLTGVPVEDDDR